ncbi:MAG: glycosyltransferase family 9 protein [Rhodospirillales bacterium]
MHILVIKLGALGDVVQAFGPFEAVRAAHPGARITLLTTRPFAEFLRPAPWFDDIIVDDKPVALNVPGWLALRARLRAGELTRVYDLQTSDRSSAYLRLFWPGPKPEWSGIARGCSHPHTDAGRDALHTVERQRGQLRAAGVTDFPEPDLAWLNAAAAANTPEISEPFALLVPGGSPGRPEKRWPPERFAELARMISAQGVTPVLLGGGADAGCARKIAAAAPGTLDMTGRTGLADIYALGRRAAFSVGNDTGPMHLIGLGGRRCAVLFSHASDPALCAPRGPGDGAGVRILRAADMNTITAEAVMGAVKK